MSSFVNNTYTYEGTDSRQYWKETIEMASTLDGTVISINPNIKKEMNIPGMTRGNSLQSDSCAWSDYGDITLATKKLTTVPYKVNKTLCKDDLEPLYIGEDMRPGANLEEGWIPAALADAIVTMEQEQIAWELEYATWNANTGGATGTYLDDFDGFIVQLLADSDVLDVAAPAVLSESNILTQLALVVDLIPKTIKRKKGQPRVGIALSVSAMEFYVKAIANGSPQAFANTVIDSGQYLGYKLFVLDGLEPDDIVAADFSNMWAGTDLQSDWENLQVIYMGIIGEDSVRFKARMRFGVGYALGSEIVLHHV